MTAPKTARAAPGSTAPRLALAAFALALPLAYVAAARPAGHRYAPYLALHAAWTVFGLLAWALLRRAPDARVLRHAVILGCAVRLLLVPVAPFTTTDVGRYLWDGAVVLARCDPYAVAPEAPALASLRASFPAPRDHLDVPTCYPPLALSLFAASAATGPRAALYAWKLLVALCSCATVLVIHRHLRATAARAPDVVLVALSPALILEGGVGAHLDVIATLFVALAVLAAERGRARDAGIAIGAAAALKLVPAVLALPLLVRLDRRARVAFVAWCALVPALTFGAALALGVVPVGSLLEVARLWYFSAPVWTVLYAYAPEQRYAIRAALAAVLVLAVVAIALWRRRDAARGARDAYGAFLYTTPFLYPWYASPLGALTALAPSAWALATLAVLPLSYEVIDAYQARGAWSPASWPTAVLAVAVVLGLAADAVLARRAK